MTTLRSLLFVPGDSDDAGVNLLHPDDPLL
jgi:hypothetical protein